MPRRYSDYPDYFRFWNIVSSFGIIIVILSLWLFIYIIIERFIRKQKIILSDKYFSNLEWKNFYPSRDHSYIDLYCIVK